ncbi:glycosyltransferase [Streptomyces virginiae]|uniref:glycosyltransferase n=1 Tax=Streptomyces virginiae TaxID=1961 RepID=UPI0032459A8F
MNDGRRVLIILPAWNEEDGLPSVLREFQQQLPYVDTLVVDDGSADNTAEVARAAGSAVGQLPFNLGVGGAMRLAYRYAQQHGYDVARCWSASPSATPTWSSVPGSPATATTPCAARASGRCRRCPWCCRASLGPSSPTPPRASAPATGLS